MDIEQKCDAEIRDLTKKEIKMEAAKENIWTNRLRAPRTYSRYSPDIKSEPLNDILFDRVIKKKKTKNTYKKSETRQNGRKRTKCHRQSQASANGLEIKQEIVAISENEMRDESVMKTANGSGQWHKSNKRDYSNDNKQKVVIRNALGEVQNDRQIAKATRTLVGISAACKSVPGDKILPRQPPADCYGREKKIRPPEPEYVMPMPFVLYIKQEPIDEAESDLDIVDDGVVEHMELNVANMNIPPSENSMRYVSPMMTVPCSGLSQKSAAVHVESNGFGSNTLMTFDSTDEEEWAAAGLAIENALIEHDRRIKDAVAACTLKPGAENCSQPANGAKKTRSKKQKPSEPDHIPTPIVVTTDVKPVRQAALQTEHVSIATIHPQSTSGVSNLFTISIPQSVIDANSMDYETTGNSIKSVLYRDVPFID